MTIDINKIETGDRIRVRTLNRSGLVTGIRVVSEVHKLRGGGVQVCIRCNGWNDYRLHDYEILEHYPKGTPITN